jgi:hypothetical protein
MSLSQFSFGNNSKYRGASLWHSFLNYESLKVGQKLSDKSLILLGRSWGSPGVAVGNILVFRWETKRTD